MLFGPVFVGLVIVGGLVGGFGFMVDLGSSAAHFEFSVACSKTFASKRLTPEFTNFPLIPKRTSREAMAKSRAAGPLRGLRVVALNGILTRFPLVSAFNLHKSA